MSTTTSWARSSLDLRKNYMKQDLRSSDGRIWGGSAFFSFRNPDGSWNGPELIVSQFAGEATLDNEGNLYFTHHFYKDAVMLDVDIYVAYKK